MQSTVKEVAQREGVPMCLEEIEMEDSSEIQINQLIDTKEIESIDKENRSVAIDDTSLVSFCEQPFFSMHSMSQNKEKKVKGKSQLLEASAQEISEDIKNIQLHAIDSKAQGSKGAKTHGAFLALS